MLLKSLKLKNIRSYKNQEIPFLTGTTLFEGDIGSGKSTILMAIEFALFGLGSEKAGALLRAGETEGSVSLIFDIDGSEYEVGRTLVKKDNSNSIQQKEGYIRTREGLLYLSPSELKEKVLEILNFNEAPDPKAQSSIYRYAVFTPQEEMKAILFMDSDSRLQILRKAFRIEDYRIARDNAKSLSNDIGRNAQRLIDISSDLDQKEKEHEIKLREIAEDTKELGILLSEEETNQKKLDNIEDQRERINEERDRLSKAIGQIPELERQNSDKQKNIIELGKRIERVQKRIDANHSKLSGRLKAKKPTEKSLKELKEERDRLQEQRDELTDNKGATKSKINDYALLEKNGICPTCDRKADPAEYKKKIEEKTTEIKDLTAKLVKLGEKIRETDELMEKLEHYNNEQREIEEFTIKIDQDQQLLDEDNAKIRSQKEEIEKNEKTLSEAKDELKQYEKLTTRLDRITDDIEEVDRLLKEAGKKTASKRTKIEESKKRVSELREEIKAKKVNVKKAGHLTEYKIWLEEYFSPTIENIEKHVLLTLNREFNELFQHWFSLLVEDPTKDAHIDEGFTPIVEQDGYEQDLKYLSGGEKTSVALSYRLALNTVVCKVSTTMKSNLLILDEPTDGFSKEQLFKIHDILKELRCSQIIIVSHEKELESFADQVFKITKIDGTSKIF